MAIVIAVDGTAASGKGTLAKKLADRYGFAYLDTGALYRLTALGVVEAGGDPADPQAAENAAKTVDPSRAGDPAIRTAEMGKGASLVSAVPAVRAALLQFQRNFAENPPDHAPGAVLDGRDIGTVVCPDAAVKLFIDATAQVRAHRRWLQVKGQGLSEADVLADIIARDARDKGRAVAPLKPAENAHLLDTSKLDIESAFTAALGFVQPILEEALGVHAKG